MNYTYKIKPGDNLYQIAINHHTTVNTLLKLNPGINPSNLKIGNEIIVYQPNSLENEMHRLWMEHVFWTRLLIISLVDNLKDTEQTTKRLLQNPGDIARLFETYYGPNVAFKVNELLTDHLVIGDQLIKAFIKNDSNAINNLNQKWYQNADSMAIAFSSINRYYKQDELRTMLYNHLDLTKEEVAARLNKDYIKDVQIFDQVEKQAIHMADDFTNGIKLQFKL